MNMQNASNKRRMIGAHLAIALFAVCSVQPVVAQGITYIEEEDRQVEPARPVAIIIAQEELASSIEIGRMVAQEGGLLGALIDRTPETFAQNAAAKAHNFSVPLRQALGEFDPQPLILEATTSGLSQVEWFGVGTPEVLTGQSTTLTRNDPLSRGDSTVSMTFALGAFDEEANDTIGALNWNSETVRLENEFAAAHSGARQIAILSWRYQISPDFTNVQVIVDIGLRTPQAPARLYRQQIISVVKLRRPTFIEEDNVAIWAANNGALTRQALEMAIARVGDTLPQVLSLDKAGFKTATNKKKRPPATGGGFHGPVLFRDDKGPVFYATDDDQRLWAFVALQTIRN